MSPHSGVGVWRAGRAKAEAKDMTGSHAASKGSASRFLAVVLGLLGVLMFLGLGIWQLERRVWKLDLIARVDQRIHASVVDAPGPQDWSGFSAPDHEYRHVRLVGRLQGGANTLVQAVTELGGGYWVLTPMRDDRGFTVLVNRGFIPQERKVDFERENAALASPATVEGLLRISEPGGGFLRSNDPAADRWYSRDVAAIAKARGLADVAPYFIDAEASGAAGWPRGGLTVVTFRNSHLIYALTWFALAGMLAMALARQVFSGRRNWDAA
ncbi:SURF1 family protein [Mesorhizobium sp. ESP-6-4]|uniref:SURF1 family protein n=1 Tax=Mesorhizobium sp. ESP-6-4 TaxID=2876624 RepID=UPI00398CD12D